MFLARDEFGAKQNRCARLLLKVIVSSPPQFSEYSTVTTGYARYPGYEYLPGSRPLISTEQSETVHQPSSICVYYINHWFAPTWSRNCSHLWIRCAQCLLNVLNWWRDPSSDSWGYNRYDTSSPKYHELFKDLSTLLQFSYCIWDPPPEN